MLPGIEIRTLHDGEIDAIGALVHETVNGAYREQAMLEPSTDPETAIAAVRRHRMLDPAGCLVAELAGDPVGAGFVRRRDGIAVLGPVVVVDRWQAQGIGKRLVQALVEQVADCEAMGVRVETFNARAIGIALGCGMGARDAVLHLIAFGGLRGPGRAAALGGGFPTSALAHRDLDDVARYDAAHFGGSRRADLEALLTAGAGALVAREAGRIAGYLVGRLEGHLGRLGPGVADTPELMATLVARVVEQLGSDAHIIQAGIPASVAPLAQQLLAMGFRSTGTALELWRGAARPMTRASVVGTPPDTL